VSEVVEVSSDWLTLREPEDARARSRELADAVAELLGPAPIVIHDLGSGTGSMTRWLAPILPGPQEWVLHDWNSSLTELAFDSPLPVDRGRRQVSISSRTGSLANLTAAELEGASLVTASALLDVLTSEEVHAIVAACVAVGAPTLLALSVTGRVDLTPMDVRDQLVATAFNEHQGRDSDGRRLLGRHAAAVARGLFLQAGWRVRPTDTLWRLDERERQLLGEWFEGWVGAACEQRPELRENYADYLDLRRSQLRRGVLEAVIHHTDLLAWPR
jgi:hypothetical protein